LCVLLNKNKKTGAQVVKSLEKMGGRIDSLASDVVALQRQVLIVANLRQIPSSPNRQPLSSPTVDSSDNTKDLASPATDRDSEQPAGLRISRYFHSVLILHFFF
jgi:hypothetical protein